MTAHFRRAVHVHLVVDVNSLEPASIQSWMDTNGASFKSTEFVRNEVYCNLPAAGCATVAIRYYKVLKFDSWRHSKLSNHWLACASCPPNLPRYSFAASRWQSSWVPRSSVILSAFTRTDLYSHTRFYTQTLLHTDSFTHRHFYTQTLLHTDTFTHRRFTQRGFYTQKLAHTERLLHTEAFECRPFYT